MTAPGQDRDPATRGRPRIGKRHPLHSLRRTSHGGFSDELAAFSALQAAVDRFAAREESLTRPAMRDG
jgi:hypothetical protein